MLHPMKNTLIDYYSGKSVRLFYVVAQIPHTLQLPVLGTFQISDCGDTVSSFLAPMQASQRPGLSPSWLTFYL